MISKRYKNLLKTKKNMNSNAVTELLSEIKKNCTTKFDESIDLSVQINNKQKKGEVNIRTVVNMPSGTGKKIKVAVLCDDANKALAQKAGADLVGSDDLIEEICSYKGDHRIQTEEEAKKIVRDTYCQLGS